VSIYWILVRHFVESAFRQKGFGLFEGNAVVIGLAKKLSKNQKKRFIRYDVVPSLFFESLRQLGFIDSHALIPEKGIAGTEFESTLKKLGARTIPTRKEYFDHELYKLSGCSQQHLWRKIFLMLRGQGNSKCN